MYYGTSALIKTGAVPYAITGGYIASFMGACALIRNHGIKGLIHQGKVQAPAWMGTPALQICAVKVNVHSLILRPSPTRVI